MGEWLVHSGDILLREEGHTTSNGGNSTKDILIHNSHSFFLSVCHVKMYHLINECL